jgi:hypothetical protein
LQPAAYRRNEKEMPEAPNYNQVHVRYGSCMSE